MKLKRQQVTEGGEPVLPLIDVVFFLLVFFMLVGRMDATSPFAVVPPLGRTGADMPAGGSMISVDTGGVLALDGTRMTADEILMQLRREIAEDPLRPVRINADGSGPLRIVLGLLAELELAGVADISLVVSPAPK